MERQQKQQDSSGKSKKIYEYEDSEDEAKNTYRNEDSTKPNQLFEEVKDVIAREDVERLEWLLLTLHFNLHHDRLLGNYTPLSWASLGSGSHSVDKLLEWAADVNRYDRWGRQPIHEAAWCGSVDCLDLLIFHVDRSKRDCQRKLILTTNAWKGRGEPTMYLVPYNHFRGDIDVRARQGLIGLHWAAMLNYIYGGSPGGKAQFYFTALHEAASFNHIDTVHYLLNLGADINAKNSEEKTPMHMAVEWFSPCVGRYPREQTAFHLWFEGADVNARDVWNQTPLDVALKAREYKEKLVKIVAMIKFLIEDKKKHEILHRYVTKRNEIADKLIERFRYQDYLLKHYTTYFLNKLKRNTDDLLVYSRFSENKEHVDEWFEDEEF